MGRFRDRQLGGGILNRLNQRIQSGPCRRVGGRVFSFPGERGQGLLVLNHRNLECTTTSEQKEQ